MMLYLLGGSAKKTCSSHLGSILKETTTNLRGNRRRVGLLKRASGDEVELHVLAEVGRAERVFENLELKEGVLPA